MISLNLQHSYADIANDRLVDIRHSSWWLKSPFGAPQMIAQFGDSEPIVIDFEIRLPSGEMLTAARNSQLLEDIYYLLCLQTHPLVNGRRKPDIPIYKDRLRRALQLTDYFLLNAEALRLEDHGLRSIIGTDLKSLLVKIASRNAIVSSIYQWEERLASYIKEESKNICDSDYKKALEREPALRTLHVPPTDFSLKGLTDEDILRGRAALYLSGMYNPTPDKKPYRLSINTRKISEIIYANTLLGKILRKSIPEELCLEPFDKYLQEHIAVPVTTGGLQDSISEQHFSSYKNTLISFKLLSEVGIGIPEKSFDDFGAYRLYDAIQLKEPGRFQTVPPDYVINSLKNAISFFYTHAEHLLESYVNVLKAAKAADTPIQKFATENSILPFLANDTRILGVKYWSLRWQMTVVENGNKKKKSKRSSENYYKRMRDDKQGLMELVHALYGAMQFIVGLLMAARNGELTDLPLDCLDETESWLRLLTRKSGYGDLRRLDERPVPLVAVDVIKTIQKLHFRLNKEGLGTGTNLFDTPSIRGGFFKSYTYYNLCLDIFHDYINAPLTRDGRRYYIRQHQLRRAFAMLFFVCCAFAGMDTLRWFLRQVDPEQVYNYLSEFIPGAVLRTMKSVAVALMARDGRSECRSLNEFLNDKFKVPAFEIIDDKSFHTYVNYLENLQAEGSVEIQPVFLNVGTETDCKLGIIVWGDNDDI
ncbi:hypothetical protein [Noviherbaspirillum aerium]|uniref:hypothetical protein n=1 Tax=Noviherbaspirillum aerium TaxID=2588497 RepID=UPI00124D8A26|nr:hypothetical protein [Noviherbaspirillum aerium]